MKMIFLGTAYFTFQETTNKTLYEAQNNQYWNTECLMKKLLFTKTNTMKKMAEGLTVHKITICLGTMQNN